MSFDEFDPSKLLVCCRGAGRVFGRGPNAVAALTSIDLEILAGQQLVLTGPSGSGKSTLLHLLAGLDRPTTGTVTWPAFGDRPLRPGPIGIAFQGPSLLPPLDVQENVALPLVLGGMEQSEANQAALEALALLGLSELANRLPEELSGGQSQRVAIARALVGDPCLILADEPTGQLDHLHGAMVVDALIDAAIGFGAALVVSTHDPKVAGRFPCRLQMASGRVVDRDSEAGHR